MSNNKKEQDSLFVILIGGAIGLAVAGIIWAMILILRLVYGWLKKPLSESMQLEDLSAGWPQWKWLYQTIAWISGLACFYYLFSLCVFFMKGTTPAQVVTAAAHVVLGILWGFPFLAVRWIQEYHADPDIQRRVAGRKAEAFVAEVLDQHLDHYPGSRTLHGRLFVFHAGEDNEFSVEADHLLVTRRHIYLIETKYKSGTIWVNDKAPEWQTSSVRGEGRMRSPLLQAKNSARVLRQFLALPTDIIPIIAIYGRDVLLVGAPGNVVAAPDVAKAIHAFEAASATDVLPLNPGEIVATLKKHICIDAEAMNKHKERAHVAKTHNELREIVRTASLK